MSQDRTLELRAGETVPELVRRAHDEQGRRRIGREIDRLTAATHPGVVTLVGSDRDQVVLAWAGSDTLETYRPGVSTAAAVVASLASTVADLHLIGVVHGRIEASHVVIGADGHPRLCGMRGVDDDEPSPDASDDVAALGRLLDRLVGHQTETDPIPDRRWGRRRRVGFQRRSLQTLADRCTDPDPARRPSARELAAAISEAVPEAGFDPPSSGGPDTATHPPATSAVASIAPSTIEESTTEEQPPLPATKVAPSEERTLVDSVGLADAGDPNGLAEPNEAHEERETRSSRAAPAAPRRASLRPLPSAMGAGIVVVVCVMAVLVGRGLLGSTVDRPSSTPEPLRPRTPTTNTSAPVTTTSTTPAPSADPPCTDTGEESTRRDIDGDGCADPVDVSGTSVTAGDKHYSVGVAGDHVQVADWDCDGVATVGLVRPDTGEVFSFPDWELAGGERTVRPATVVSEAVELVAPAPDGVGCSPAVRLADGTEVDVDLTEGGVS